MARREITAVVEGERFAVEDGNGEVMLWRIHEGQPVTEEEYQELAKEWDS